MHRLLAIGCILALGCASQPAARTAGQTGPDGAGDAPGLAPVSAGPAGCDALFTRIHGSETTIGDTHTWLDAPDHNVESRRLRALRARAQALGCLSPRG
jgi:hypothetical protein